MTREKVYDKLGSQVSLESTFLKALTIYHEGAPKTGWKSLGVETLWARVGFFSTFDT